MSRMGSLRDRLNRSVSPVKSPSQLFDNHSESGDVNMSSLVDELKAARTLNRSVSIVFVNFVLAASSKSK